MNRRVLSLLLVSLAGCGGTESPTDTVAPETPVATAVTLSTATLSFLSLGETQQLAATVTHQNGAPLSGASVTWASSVPSVASVSSTGLVTALTNGTATITATSGSASGTVSVTVQQVAASVTLSPTTLSFSSIGETQQLTATIQDGNDNVVPGASIGWASSDPAVAMVNGTGLANAVAVGTATITATSGAASGTSAITVDVDSPPTVTITAPSQDTTVTSGDAITLAATASDAEDGDLTASIAWSSDIDGALGSGGTVTPTLSVGVHTITATVQDRAGQPASDLVTVTVPAPPVATIDAPTAGNFSERILDERGHLPRTAPGSRSRVIAGEAPTSGS